VIDDLFRDLRYACRMFRRGPGFVAAAVLSLALGIGANTAMFSIVDRLMFRPLPVRDPSQLVILRSAQRVTVDYETFDALRERAPGVADLSAIVRTDRYNVGMGANRLDEGPVRLALVSGTYFSTLGVNAAIGRTLTAEHDRPGLQPVAVISDSYWETRFARAPDVVGHTLTFNGDAYEIIGVAPRGFSGEWVGRPADLWIPIVNQPRIMLEIPLGLAKTGVVTIGRLHSEVTLPQADAALQIAFHLALRESAGANPTPQQLQEIARERLLVEEAGRGYSPQRQSFGQSLTILMIAVGLVLLVACANIANLLLARSEARLREMAVRTAIGAARSRIVRQVLTESVLLATMGGLLGLAFARWATSILAVFMRSGPVGNAVALSMDLDVQPDARFLAFTAVLCLVTGVLFGLAPAVRASSVTLAPSLTGRGVDSTGTRGRFRPGKLLVVSQVAVSLVLLIGAGLFLRTLRNLTTQDLGFDREHLLLIWTLPGQTGGRGAGASDFWQRVQQGLSSVPGVISASASNQGVLNGSDLSGLSNGPAIRVEGEAPLPSGPPGLRAFVAPGFFKTMGVPLVAGREFTEQDTAAAPRVVIISQTMARYYFGDRNPVGRRLGFPEDAGTTTEIIGLARDFTGGTPREVTRKPAQTYFSYRDKEAARRLRAMTIAVRTQGDPRAIAATLRRELRNVDPNLPVLKIDTVDEQLNDVLVQERLVASLSAFFGALAVLLACVGLNGVISFTVARRTSEMGIRLALGATRGQVLWAVLKESLVLVAAGLVTGVPAALALTRLVASRLFGVGPTDVATIAGAVAVIVALSAVAGLLPAQRAACVDPMLALRCD
jgi:predicted permease